MKPYQFCLLLACFGGYIAYEKSDAWLPAPSPVVNADVSETSERAGRAYLLGLAESFERGAASKADDQKLHSELIESNRAARKKAFAPLDEVLQEVTPETRQATLQSIANGLRKAAKEK